MITKDGRDTAIENLTADNYIVPQGEERFYHAVIEVRQFDPKTGKRISKPRLQKFGQKMFETHILASLKKQGYIVTILHDPRAWVKENAEKAKLAAEKATAEKAKAEEQRFNEAVDKAVNERINEAVAAAVAKALAEQQAQQKQADNTETEQADKDKGEQAEHKKPGRPAKTESEK